MKLAALVSLRLPPAILGLAGAELAEVLCRPGHGVLEELEGDAAQRLACFATVSELVVGMYGLGHLMMRRESARVVRPAATIVMMAAKWRTQIPCLDFSDMRHNVLFMIGRYIDSEREIALCANASHLRQ